MLPIIVALAWPTMLEQLMQTAVQYIDTAMVREHSVHMATAAVGATSTVNWLINSTISAISIGFLSYISQALGAAKTDQAKKAASQAVLVSLITGIFFTILTVSLSGIVPKCAGRSFDPKNGFLLFSDPVSSNAAPHYGNYPRNGTACRR